jgi:hypothetical protein
MTTTLRFTGLYYDEFVRLAKHVPTRSSNEHGLYNMEWDERDRPLEFEHLGAFEAAAAMEAGYAVEGDSAPYRAFLIQPLRVPVTAACVESDARNECSAESGYWNSWKGRD